MRIKIDNIFRATAGAIGSEEFLTLLETEAVKIQRIVSHASRTPGGLNWRKGITWPSRRTCGIESMGPGGSICSNG